MTRYHGITEKTFEKVIIDSGAVYYNFTDLSNPGTLLGATRGGNVFTRKPKYIDLPYEGIPGKVVGSKHLAGVEVTLEVNILTFDDSNMLLAIPNSVLSAASGYSNITEEEWDASAVHTLDNIVLVGERANGGDPIILVLKNPICESDFSVALKDKSEVVSKWKFSAYYATSDLSTPPWEIGVPSSVITLDKFIIVGSSLSAFYTDDPTTWVNTGSMPSNREWKDIAYSADLGRFVAVGDTYTYAAYSNDGINWTEVSLPSGADSWDKVACGNGLFVTIGWNSSKSMYSTDGITWLEGTMPSSKYWEAVAFGNDKFVAIARSSNVSAYSTDGNNWSSGGSIAGYWIWYDMAYSSALDMFVAIAYNTANFAYSTDGGASWTTGTLPSASNWQGITWSPTLGLFVVVGNSSVGAYSSDGINWTASTLPSSRAWYSVKWGNGYFIAPAFNSNKAMYSTDGINWNEVTLPASGWWQGCGYG